MRGPLMVHCTEDEVLMMMTNFPDYCRQRAKRWIEIEDADRVEHFLEMMLEEAPLELMHDYRRMGLKIKTSKVVNPEFSAPINFCGMIDEDIEIHPYFIEGDLYDNEEDGLEEEEFEEFA